jgi:mono/diheme cytochrome c family protein
MVFMLSSFPAAGRNQNQGRRASNALVMNISWECFKWLEPRGSLVSVGLMVAATLATTPTFGADADNGRRLARRWCTPCHVVASRQRGTTSEAPPFSEIASRPDFNAARIALFLLDPHPKMPDMGLSRTDAGDLAAYIATLK